MALILRAKMNIKRKLQSKSSKDSSAGRDGVLRAAGEATGFNLNHTKKIEWEVFFSDSYLKRIQNESE